MSFWYLVAAAKTPQNAHLESKLGFLRIHQSQSTGSPR